MNPDEVFGFGIGLVVGTVAMALFSTYLRDRGREECDLHLPRTEHCVLVWIAPTKESK